VTPPIIPEAALAQHIAVLGKTGSGKSFAAKAAIVEPALAAARRVGIVDPTSAWWGLRSSRDGKSPGFPILVLGGDHGDLPLPALGGAAVARLLVEQGVNLIADTKHLTIGERTRWFIDFAGTISRINRTPLHLVIDEAHNFAPQGKVPDPDTGKMLHAANTLASGGRSLGIRLTMITQRPAKLHKDSLTCADTLIAMRVLAPQDRLAVEDWIKGCGNIAQGKEVLNSLASLQRGEGWVWYPEGGHLARSKFPQIMTFDSSATPKDGHAVATPKGAAEIDLSEIQGALADAVKQAAANDPKALRAKIAALERDLKKGHDAGPTPEWRAEYEAAHARDTAAAYERGRVESSSAMLAAANAIGGCAATISRAATELATIQLRLTPDDAPRFAKPANIIPKLFTKPVKQNDQFAEKARLAGFNGRLSGPQQCILNALAWLESVGVDRADRVRAAMLASASPRSSGYERNISTLKTAALIDYPASGFVCLTDAGRAAAHTSDRPPTVEDLHDAIRRKVSRPQWSILEALIKHYPKDFTREQVAERARASAASSGFERNISTLRSLGFIDYPASGRVVALPTLFLDGP